MHEATRFLSQVPLFSSFPCAVLFLFSAPPGGFYCPGALPGFGPPPIGPLPLSVPPPLAAPPEPHAEHAASTPPEPPAVPPISAPPEIPANPPIPAEHPPTAGAPAPRSLAASPEAAAALIGFQPYVERILRGWRVPDRDVPDIAQNVLVQVLPWWAAHTPAERESAPGRCRAYIATTARHAACHRHRSIQTRPEDIGITGDWFDAEQGETASSLSLPTVPSAEDVWIEHEEAAELAAEVDLDRLASLTSPAFWRAFYAHTVAGLPAPLIAEAEGVPAATIYQRLRLARHDLRAALLRLRAARRPR